MDSLWNNFEVSTSGAGTSSATGNILTSSAIVGDTGYHKHEYPCAEGEIYTFSVEARVLTNNGTDPNPGLFVDYPTFPSSNNHIYFNSTEWKYYELRFVVYGDNVKSTDYFTLGAGSWTTTDGSCEIRNPRLRAETITPIVPSIWACGWFEIDNAGAVTIIEQCNIVSAVWTSGGGSADSYLTITAPGIPSSLLTVQPRPKAIGTTTGPDQYIPKADHRIVGVAGGDFEVKILDAGAGTYIQAHPASTTRFYVEVSY